MNKQVAKNIRKALRSPMVHADSQCLTIYRNSIGVRADVVGLALLGSLDMDVERAETMAQAMYAEVRLHEGLLDDGPATLALCKKACLTVSEAIALKKANFNGKTAVEIARAIEHGEFVVEPA